MAIPGVLFFSILGKLLFMDLYGGENSWRVENSNVLFINRGCTDYNSISLGAWLRRSHRWIEINIHLDHD